MLPYFRIKQAEDSKIDVNANLQNSSQNAEILQFHYCPTSYNSSVKVIYGADEKTKGTTSAKKKYKRTDPEVISLKLFFNDVGVHRTENGTNIDFSTLGNFGVGSAITQKSSQVAEAIQKQKSPPSDQTTEPNTISGLKRKTVFESLNILRDFAGGQGATNENKVPAPVLELVGLREEIFVCVISKISIKTTLFSRTDGKPVRATVSLKLIERVSGTGLVEKNDGRLYYDILTDKVQGLDRDIGGKFANALIEKETVSSGKLRQVRKAGK